MLDWRAANPKLVVFTCPVDESSFLPLVGLCLGLELLRSAAHARVESLLRANEIHEDSELHRTDAMYYRDRIDWMYLNGIFIDCLVHDAPLLCEGGGGGHGYSQSEVVGLRIGVRSAFFFNLTNVALPWSFGSCYRCNQRLHLGIAHDCVHMLLRWSILSVLRLFSKSTNFLWRGSFPALCGGHGWWTCPGRHHSASPLGIPKFVAQLGAQRHCWHGGQPHMPSSRQDPVVPVRTFCKVRC